MAGKYYGYQFQRQDLSHESNHLLHRLERGLCRNSGDCCRFYFTGDVLLPASAWIALGIPTAAIGGILIPFGLTKP
jgi:hypothetical protein